MRSDCDICGGRGKITLPVRLHASACRMPSTDTARIRYEESSREYACPECSEVADDNRIMVAHAHQEFPAHYARDPGFMEHVRRSMAPVLADLMIKDGFVRFADGREDVPNMTRSLHAYVGVVAVGAAKRIEDRINERQFDVADEVIKAASAEIRHWGSAFSGPEGNIGKGHAVETMLNALKAIKAKGAG